MDRINWSIRALLYSQYFKSFSLFTKTSVLCPGPYGFWEVHTALDGPRLNQSNRELLSCYTIMPNKVNFFSVQIRSQFGMALKIPSRNQTSVVFESESTF